MIRNVEPIGHVPPYKRMDLWGPRPPTEIIDLLTDDAKAALRSIQMREADRTWAITRQVAEGCNAPPVTASEVCMDGWEVA